MRFRLGTTGAAGGQQMFDGVSRGFANLGMMPVYQAQAADEAQNADMKRQLIGSQMRESDAHAALYGQQGEDLRAQQARGGFDQLARTALAINRVSPDQIPEASNYLQTGKLPSMYQAPGGDGVGPVAPAPDYANAGGLGGRIMQTLGLLQGGLTVGDKDIAHIADAQGKYQDQGITDAAVAAAGRGDDMAMSRLNTVRGKKEFTPYKAVGNTGTALNEITGSQDTSNAGLRVLFGQGEQAQINQRNAAAGASGASAEHSRASTSYVNEQTNQLKNAPKGVLVQTDTGPVFSDPRSGASVPVLNADGSPAAPKLKDIPPAQNHAFIENAKALQNIDSAIQAIETTTGIKLDANGNPVRVAGVTPTAPDALGGRNYLGDGIRQRTDPKGVSVRAQVANIGGQRFHDVSGAAVSVGEAKRLQPFIPQSTDGPGVALQKLVNMRREYQNVNDMLTQTYSRDQGFKPSMAVRPAPQAGGGGGVVDLHALPTAGASAGGQTIDFGSLR